jgi:chromosome segregation ATPase
VEQLEKENAELSGPAKAIGELRNQVDDLTTQLAQSSKAKSDAERRALAAQQAADAAQRTASSAQAVINVAKQEATQARAAYNKCQAQLKNCGNP